MTTTGELGLPATEVGHIAQALGFAAVQRGRVSKEEVVAYMTSDAFDETGRWWDPLGDIIDHIEEGTIDARGPSELNPLPEDIILCTLAKPDEETDAHVALADQIVADLRASGFAIVPVPD